MPKSSVPLFPRRYPAPKAPMIRRSSEFKSGTGFEPASWTEDSTHLLVTLWTPTEEVWYAAELCEFVMRSSSGACSADAVTF